MTTLKPQQRKMFYVHDQIRGISCAVWAFNPSEAASLAKLGYRMGDPDITISETDFDLEQSSLVLKVKYE